MQTQDSTQQFIYTGQMFTSMIGLNTKDNWGIFGSYLKYYNHQQLLFGTNSPNTDLGISEVYFGYGVRLENDHTPSNLTINASGAYSGMNKPAPNITIAGGKATGTGAGGDIIFSTSTALSSGTTLQSLTNRWWVKYNTGYLGNSSTPTSTLDLTGATGHSQFRLRTSYTPTSTSDTNGNTGDFSWDDNYFYIKTSAGWKRSALSTF